MKKLSNFTIAALLLTGLFLFATSACKKAAEDRAEQKIEKAIEEADGTEAEVDITDSKITVETDEGTTEIKTGMKEWPKGIPNEVPRFNYGTFETAMTGDTPENMTWVLNFSDVRDKDIDDFEARLRKAGFKVSKMTITGMGLTLAGNKDDLAVTVRYAENSAVVGVNKEK